MRIGDAIKHQHQRIGLRRQRVDQIAFRPDRQRLDLRHHALMDDIAQPALDEFRFDTLDAYIGGSSQRLDFAAARIITAQLQ